VFSTYVHPDGLVNAVKEQDMAYENQGNSGLVLPYILQTRHAWLHMLLLHLDLNVGLIGSGLQ
jgi:hypothetical protein